MARKKKVKESVYELGDPATPILNAQLEKAGLTDEQVLASAEAYIVEGVNDGQESSPVTPAKPTYEVTFPDLDRDEMDRVKRVINNRDAAWRISDNITHQRDYGLWGVHQYSDSSKNTFARSFYFRELDNARVALEYTKSLLG